MRKVEHFRNLLSQMNFLNAYSSEPVRIGTSNRPGSLYPTRRRRAPEVGSAARTTVCDFNPPSPSWATQKRIQMDEESTFGIDAFDRPTPPFVPCSRFSLRDAAPEDSVLLTPDGHCGYRTLAYLLFFEESLYMKLRSVLSQYVIDNADASWVRRKFRFLYALAQDRPPEVRKRPGGICWHFVDARDAVKLLSTNHCHLIYRVPPSG